MSHLHSRLKEWTCELEFGTTRYNFIGQQPGKQIRQKMKNNEVDLHKMHKIHKEKNTFHIRGRVTTVPSEVLEMRCLLSVLF